MLIRATEIALKYMYIDNEALVLAAKKMATKILNLLKTEFLQNFI
jgi:hypothetical protein